MDHSTVLTSMSVANQTAVPSRVRRLLKLKHGDKLVWRIDQSKKTISISPAPTNWGTYLRGLGKKVWTEDAQTYVARTRQDRHAEK